jgi:hypothetical protein
VGPHGPFAASDSEVASRPVWQVSLSEARSESGHLTGTGRSGQVRSGPSQARPGPGYTEAAIGAVLLGRLFEVRLVFY